MTYKRALPISVIASGILACAVIVPINVFASDTTNSAQKQALLNQLTAPHSTPGSFPKGLALPEGGVAQAVPLTAGPHAGEILTPDGYGGVPQPFSASTMTVTNMWLNIIGRNYVGVYAGYLPDDPQQGAIFVAVQNSDSAMPAFPSGLVKLGSRAGALSLVQVVPPDVIAKDAAGNQHHFNMNTRAFTS